LQRVATILVVDDRPIHREFLTALLRYAGHRVLQAGDGTEALGLVRGETPDLIISDILMPVMDGVELVKRLRSDPALDAIEVVFYTATYRIGEARALADSCGVATVIPKPSEPQVLLDAVHEALHLPPRRAIINVPQPPVIARAAVAQRLRTSYMAELADLRAQLQQSLDEDPAGGPRREHGNRLASDIERSLLRAQALSMRLSALVELSLELTQTEDPTDLLRMFCHAARDILNAKIAGVCTLDEEGRLVEFATWGLSDSEARAVRANLDPHAKVLGEVLRDGEPRRLSVLGGRAVAVGLPASHPPVDNLLTVAVRSGSQTYGWFYVANRIGAREFPQSDEQVALMLASQLGPAYASRVLFDQAKRHAAVLELEIDERKEAAERTRESELRFRELAENIREVFLLVDTVNGRMLYVSPTYEEVWQRSRDTVYAHVFAWMESIHAEDRARVDAVIAGSRDSGRFDMEFRIVRPDASVRWIRSRSFPIHDASGTIYRLAGICEDITDAKLQDLSIRRLSRIHRVLSGTNSAIVRIHERDELLDEACRIAVEEGGFPIAWIAMQQADNAGTRCVASRGIDADTLAQLDDYLGNRRNEQWNAARSALESRRPVVINSLSKHLGDAGPVSHKAVELGYGSVISLPLMPNGEIAGVLLLYAAEADYFDDQELALLEELAGDVSFALQYISKEEQLNYLAYYDPLTGLPNASLLRERLGQLVARGQAGTAAVFLVDIDRFAQLNDSLGRHVGDRLLTSVGARLQRAVPDNGTLARVGPDSFAIAIPALRQDTEAGAILQERILSTLAKPFVVDANEIRVSARAGIAVYPSDGTDAETLLKNAEAALKEAKASGVRYLFYSPQLNARVADDLALEQQLLAAFERGEFVVFYQPKIAAQSGALIGVEALVRWRNREGVLVPPDQFIRVLEETELILDVGRWVLEKALADYKAWQQKGLRPLRIAVNVSPIQLRYADFPEMVLGAIERSGVDGNAIELEITESVIMGDIEANTARLERISARGVTIAIDDFGTGYSSLRYLAKLPVHSLKIDRSFIVSMGTDADSMTLVSTIVGLAHSFGLTVVAEGVDSEDQAQMLRMMKCDYLQGYLFGKPVPATEIEKILTEQPERPPQLPRA
jgi:diguanylate cyclase (GGDEF)-like protein/PAS domain S-box-containing protein